MLVGVVLLAAGCLAAYGDTAFSFVVENGTSRVLTVSVLRHTVRLGACSVCVIGGGGPPLGVPFVLTATDDAGQVVFTTTMTLRRSGEEELMYIQIPGSGGDACPTPPQGFTFQVWNHNKGVVELWMKGRRLGAVAPESDATFGPLSGSWRDAAEIVVRDEAGVESLARYLNFWFEQYGPGDTPHIQIGVPETLYR